MARADIPIAITLGDPAGIGPELAAYLWINRGVLDLPTMVFVGGKDCLSPFLKATDDLPPVVDCPLGAEVVPGKPDAANATSVVKSLETALSLIDKGEARALMTLPINKEGLAGTDFGAPGHTEFLARRAGLKDDEVVMMLACDALKVVPLTVHIAIAKVPAALTHDVIVQKALITARDMKRRFGIEKPRLAFAGLNPHAGEGGLMGHEEATHIRPALWTLQDMGLDVTGPLPADTMFHIDARKSYDAALCMYHDQALIPIKTLDFWGGVNVTLGLDYVRTSPDHGTAFEIAGQSLARPESALAALQLADKMSA